MHHVQIAVQPCSVCSEASTLQCTSVHLTCNFCCSIVTVAFVHSRNYLQKLPPSLCEIELETLSVNNNRLQRLPQELGRMTTLKSLVSQPSIYPPQVGVVCPVFDI